MNQELTLLGVTYLKVIIIDNQQFIAMKEMKKYNDADRCPIRNILDRFGDKWSTLILLVLDEGQTLRFNEIYKCIESISQKMLTVTLKNLEADGLIKRTVYPQVPPKVEYELTERGRSLLPIIHELVEWAKGNMDNIMKDRELSTRV
ncbi:helix-turn-helix domain-containing protein [Limibacter armeniacum]|uniref:winged helix-turn-helix transcriptional regulator n=1 Tax=Limibacter armeniacum TaxID=466084 RepID=UPI002FE56E90